jgi:hypothetical protein
MTDRAREALELIERDGDARADFAAAYTGGADAVRALRERVEPDAAAAAAHDERLARLRRLAFGRTETGEDEAAATEARRELEAIAAGERARRDSLDRAIAAALGRRAHPSSVPDTAPEADTAEFDDPDDLEPEKPRRSWLLPAATGLVVGALVVAVLAWAYRPGAEATDAPTARPTSTGTTYFLGDPPPSTAVPGDLAAAERWFDTAQTDDDLVGVGELRPEFDRDSVRLVHSSALARVWLAKRVDGKLCLETTESATLITSGTCATTDDFASRGLSVSSNVLTANWNGAQVRVVLARR